MNTTQLPAPSWYNETIDSFDVLVDRFYSNSDPKEADASHYICEQVPTFEEALNMLFKHIADNPILVEVDEDNKTYTIGYSIYGTTQHTQQPFASYTITPDELATVIEELKKNQ